jgi:hypothetical protein
LPVLEHLDAQRYESCCYSDRPWDDSTTARLKAAAHGWRDSRTLSDQALSDQIHADQIDILIKVNRLYILISDLHFDIWRSQGGQRGQGEASKPDVLNYLL